VNGRQRLSLPFTFFCSLFVSDLRLNSCKKKENQAVFLNDFLENRLKTEENSSPVVDRNSRRAVVFYLLP